MFHAIPNGELKISLCDAAVKAHNLPEKTEQGQVAAGHFLHVALKLPRAQRQAAYLEMALYEPPNTALKVAAADAWANMVGANPFPELRLKAAFSALSKACFDELAPGMTSEGERCRRDDIPYSIPVITRGLKIVLSTLSETPYDPNALKKLIGIADYNNELRLAIFAEHDRKDPHRNKAQKRILTAIRAALD